MRRSASSSFAWQKRESCTPRSKSSSERSSARSPSSSFLTIVSSSAIAASKSLMVGESARFYGSGFQSRFQRFHGSKVPRTSQLSLASRERDLDAVAGRRAATASRRIAVRSSFQQTA